MLTFREITLDDLPTVSHFIAQSQAKTCDYTVGGIYIWIEYFRYECCIYNDTFFLKGALGSNLSTTAFSLPLGAMPLNQSINLLREYCSRHDMPLILSAIPEEYIPQLTALGAETVAELPEWFDYEYPAKQIAEYAGNKMKNKRNHANKFLRLYPHNSTEEINQSNIAEVIRFFSTMPRKENMSEMAIYENRQTLSLLYNIRSFPYEGMLLRADGKIASFAIWEIVGDRMYLHIQKTDHTFQGATEFIDMQIAKTCIEKHSISTINREDDAGDPGLRKSKLSYAPSAILKKYSITMQPTHPNKYSP